ncbi:MAG: hypothetical protein HN391_08020, partial [Anaerolineae bacterium]|nr:hypothetical protein [Anaerolineae bacterium]
LAYEETLSIPKRRVELYEEALDALLKKWDSRRRIKRDKTYEKLSLGRKKQMFARIAVEYFEKGEIFFKKKDVAQKIELFLNNLPPDTQDETPDGEAILETISAQHGILVERAKGVYSFSHLTFQEYYTAKYITDNAISGTLNRLSLHLNDRRWREVFLLTASLLHEASPLFKALQSSAQNLLDKRKELHIVQRWCIEQATTHSTHHTSVLRSLCWFIPLNIARAHTLERSLKRVLNRDHSFTRKMVQDIARALEHSDLLNRSLARAFATDKPRGHDFNSMVLEPTYKRARTLHHDIDRARVIVHARINDRTLILTQAIKLKSLRSLARKMSDDLSRDRNFTRERGLARKIDIVLARAQDKAHFIDRNSTNALDLERALDHALERALELDLGLESEFSKALDITIAPETKKIIQHSLDWYISRHTSSTSASLDFVFFKKGVIKTNIFLLASIFQKLPKKERQQKHLKILKRLLENGDETFTCPSYKASDKVWENFYAKSKNSTESFLELRIEDIKNLDIDIAQSYIAANQLFWDCLQVATVEDREAIEDMILNVPEGWEMPEENGAD